MTTNLNKNFFSNYCWNNDLYSNINTGENRIGRIIACDRGLYLCALPEGKIHVRPMKDVDPEGREPATGDWVLLGEERASPDHPYPSPELFTPPQGSGQRNTGAGPSPPTAIFVLIQISCEEGLRQGKALRLTEAARESGAAPVLLLNKADLCEDPALLTAGYSTLLPGVPVLPISAATGEGMDLLQPYTVSGQKQRF